MAPRKASSLIFVKLPTGVIAALTPEQYERYEEKRKRQAAESSSEETDSNEPKD